MTGCHFSFSTFLISRVILKHLISGPLFPISSFGFLFPFHLTFGYNHWGLFPPASFHVFHIIVITLNPQFPASSYSFFFLIWLYYSSYDSLNLFLSYLSQLTKHLFFAVFSSNLPSFISIFYSWLHFFPVLLFSPLAINANLSLLISIILLFLVERSALTRETSKQTGVGDVGPGGWQRHFIGHMEELLFVKNHQNRRERKNKWWYIGVTQAWLPTPFDIYDSFCLH